MAEPLPSWTPLVCPGTVRGCFVRSRRTHQLPIEKSRRIYAARSLAYDDFRFAVVKLVRNGSVAFIRYAHGWADVHANDRARRHNAGHEPDKRCHFLFGPLHSRRFAANVMDDEILKAARRRIFAEHLEHFCKGFFLRAALREGARFAVVYGEHGREADHVADECGGFSDAAALLQEQQ